MKAHMQSGGRYPVLRALGILCIVAAGLLMVGGVITAFYALFRVTDTFGGRLFVFAGVLAGSFISTVLMLAFAEMIKLFIDLEHNTRMQAGNFSTDIAGNSQPAGHVSRVSGLDEETAEAALLRGH